MPRITDIMLLDKPAQPTIFIREKTALDQLPPLIGSAYGKMAEYLAQQGALLAEVPCVAFYVEESEAEPSDVVEVEMIFPLATPLPGNGEIQAGELPAGRKMVCVYMGPYDDMEQTYQELARFADQNGLKKAGPFIEQHYNGPDVDQSQHLTVVTIPVK